MITKIQLFDFVKCFLVDSKKYNEITYKCKKKHLFMTFRILATKYPKLMNGLNGCESVELLDSLHKRMHNDLIPCPNWIYSMYGGEKNKESKLGKISKEVKIEFCRRHETEFKNLDLWVRTYGIEDTLKEMKEIENEFKDKIKKQKRRS